LSKFADLFRQKRTILTNKFGKSRQAFATISAFCLVFVRNIQVFTN